MPEIRPATEQDAEAVAAIYAYYVTHSAATFETEPPPPSEIEERRLAVVSHGLPYLVVEMDGTIAGFAYAGPYRLRPAYRFTVEDSIYLDPRFTGQGLGRPLLSKVVESCEEMQRREMVAIIGDSTNLASTRLHSALGFHRVGVLEGVGWKFGRWVDTVIMQRSLYRGDSPREL